MQCAQVRLCDAGQTVIRRFDIVSDRWRRLPLMNTDMADEKSWLDAADKACYIAKRDGRGLLRIATPMQSDELHTTQG